MPDILIRNVPEADVALLDDMAQRLGLSRTDFLRRQLHTEAHRATPRVTVDDLRLVAELGADLADPEVMEQAWS